MKSNPSCPPVLLLAFNRADTTQRVLSAVKAARPSRLFFAVDGPRPERPEDGVAVRRVRELISLVDWDCEVKTLFRDRNLGCKTAVSQAISWFFDAVDAGIVLEDDCLPDPSFFPFASELLERFKDDERISLVSGNNFQSGAARTAYSYYFSRYNHIWGWGSWRRAWRLYDHRMTSWPEVRDGGWLLDLLGDRRAVAYWTKIFDATHADANTSWAYRWTFACWINSTLSVLPRVNLVSNIGFGEQATHTNLHQSPLARLPTFGMQLPLAHPPFVLRDAAADERTERNLFSGPRAVGRIGRKLARLLRSA